VCLGCLAENAFHLFCSVYCLQQQEQQQQRATTKSGWQPVEVPRLRRQKVNNKKHQNVPKEKEGEKEREKNEMLRAREQLLRATQLKLCK